MQLRVATFNVWGLPWPFSVHKRKRFQQLLGFIHDTSPDIFALQEIWLNYDIHALADALPEYHVFAKHWKLYNPSGLVLISRFPITSSVYLPFHIRTFHKEMPAQKGILACECRLNGRTIQLLNTHVYYSSTEFQSKEQISQVKKLVAFLDRRPTLLFGDFNVSYEKLSLPKDFSIISDMGTNSMDDNNLYRNSRFNKVNMSNRLPDMMFANFPVKVIRKFIATETSMSDHYPVVTDISF